MKFVLRRITGSASPDSSADTGQEGLWIPAPSTLDGLEALVAAAYRRMSRRASTFREEKMSEFSLMIGENVTAKKKDEWLVALFNSVECGKVCFPGLSGFLRSRERLPIGLFDMVQLTHSHSHSALLRGSFFALFGSARF